jgi:hypothetical protein
MDQDITIWITGLVVIVLLVTVFAKCVKGDSDD